MYLLRFLYVLLYFLPDFHLMHLLNLDFLHQYFYLMFLHFHHFPDLRQLVNHLLMYLLYFLFFLPDFHLMRLLNHYFLHQLYFLHLDFYLMFLHFHHFPDLKQLVNHLLIFLLRFPVCLPDFRLMHQLNLHFFHQFDFHLLYFQNFLLFQALPY